MGAELTIERDETVRVPWRSALHLNYVVGYRPTAIELSPNDYGEDRRVQAKVGNGSWIGTREEWDAVFATLDNAARNEEVKIDRAIFRPASLGAIYLTLYSYDSHSKVKVGRKRLERAVRKLFGTAPTMPTQRKTNEAT